MAEEKPFEPTPSRLARAKREGDLPRSQEVSAVTALACAALAVAASLGPLATAAVAALTAAAHGRIAAAPYGTLAACAFAAIGAGACGAIVAALLQQGAFTVRFPAPSLARLDPFAGVRRLLSRDSAIAAAKAAVIATAVCCALVPLVRGAFASGIGAPPAAIAAGTERTLAVVVASALAVAALFAAADAVVERIKWRRRLRMSFDELKRDHKQTEGNPEMRGRRRHAHRALARGSIARIDEAAFVVCNPTHVAVALAYRPPAVPVPAVLIRASGEAALAVRRRAAERRVPIVEDVALARMLFATCDVDEPIPAAAYVAVAAIVASLVREARS